MRILNSNRFKCFCKGFSFWIIFYRDQVAEKICSKAHSKIAEIRKCSFVRSCSSCLMASSHASFPASSVVLDKFSRIRHKIRVGPNIRQCRIKAGSAGLIRPDIRHIQQNPVRHVGLSGIQQEEPNPAHQTLLTIHIQIIIVHSEPYVWIT